MNEDGRKSGLLLVGHGTREPKGVRDFLEVADEVQRRLPGMPMEPCFLELARPTIEEGVCRLVERGVRCLVVSPLLLFAAGHVRRDIPAAVSAAVARHPGVEVRQAPHLGNSLQIVELSRRRFAEALAGHAELSAEEILLILVGRGNRDPRALEEMREFVEIRRKQMPAVQVKHCYLAMARPSFREALPQAAGGPARRIVVQPHLLFPGLLLEEIASEVGSLRIGNPSVELIVSSPLGPDPALAEAVLAGLADSRGFTEPGWTEERKVG